MIIYKKYMGLQRISQIVISYTRWLYVYVQRRPKHMTNVMKEKSGTQRVFQHADGRYILLTKAGRAVSFWIDEQDAVRVLQELKSVDFKATGTQLKKEGWKCIGPGIEFDRLLEGQK